MKIPYKKVGAGYYVLDNGKEIMMDEETIYFHCDNTIVKKSRYQKTIKRIIRAYYRGRNIAKGEW